MNCLIYVHTTTTSTAVADDLRALLGGDDGPAPWAFEVGATYVSVRGNEFADEDAAVAFPDGFLHFPLYVEISNDDESEAGEDAGVALASRMLQHLWDQRVPAVAASSFEERLPHGGGGGSTEVPWPPSSTMG